MRRSSRPLNIRFYENLVLFFLYIIAICLFIKYSHRYGNISDIVTFVYSITIVIVVGLFDTENIKKLNRKSFKYLFLGLSKVIFIGLTFWSTYELKQGYDEWQLEKNGQNVYAIISRHEETHGKGGTFHYATFLFTFENEIYTQKVRDENSYFEIDDSLLLNISTKNPEIFKIIGVKKSN
jgi:hypothetical protein